MFGRGRSRSGNGKIEITPLVVVALRDKSHGSLDEVPLRSIVGNQLGPARIVPAFHCSFTNY